MLDDDDRIARVAELVQGGDQAVDVVRVEADGRFVEHVERVHQPRSERGRQGHALRLPPGERPRLAVERQIAQSDPVEIVEPPLDPLDHPSHDRVRPIGMVDPRQERSRLDHRQTPDGRDIEAADLHGQHFGA